MWTRQNAKIKSRTNCYNNSFWHPKATSYNMKICCSLRFTSYSGTNYRGCRAAFWMTAALWNGRCRWSLKRLFDVMIQIYFSSLNRAIGQILALRWPAVDPGVGRAPAEICRSWKRSKNRRLYVPVIQSYHRNSRLDAKNCRSWDLLFFDMSDKF